MQGEGSGNIKSPLKNPWTQSGALPQQDGPTSRLMLMKPETGTKVAIREIYISFLLKPFSDAANHFLFFDLIWKIAKLTIAGVNERLGKIMRARRGRIGISVYNS